MGKWMAQLWKLHELQGDFQVALRGDEPITGGTSQRCLLRGRQVLENRLEAFDGL